MKGGKRDKEGRWDKGNRGQSDAKRCGKHLEAGQCEEAGSPLEPPEESQSWWSHGKVSDEVGIAH